MSFTQWLAAAVVSLPCVAFAQNTLDPTDPQIEVPVFSYRSAFKNYQPVVDEKQAPDKHWRAANEEAGRLGGHAGQLKELPMTPAPAANGHQHGTGSKEK